MLGVGNADDILAPFGSSTVFTFIGAFIIAQAMLQNGLARRFAFRMLALPRRRQVDDAHDHHVRRHHGLLSAFVSNTATVAMLLPTAVAILGTLAGMIEDKTGTRRRPSTRSSCASASR